MHLWNKNIAFMMMNCVSNIRGLSIHKIIVLCEFSNNRTFVM